MAQLEQPYKQPERFGWQQRVRVRQADGTVKRLQKGGFKTRADAMAWRDQMAGVGAQRVTLTELVDRYLAVYDGAESTKKMLRWKLDKALSSFERIRPAALTREEVQRWRLTIPEGHRFETTQALKQAFRWAGEAGLIERHHPILDVKNPPPTRPEARHFETWEEVEALADEIDPRYAALIIFAAGTGLRPGEWAALEWRDLELNGPTATVTVRRRLTKDKMIVDATKNGKHRKVPLRSRVAAALRQHPARLGTQIVFPAPKGGMIDLHNWREDFWHPACVATGFVTAAGKPDRGPYALRHTFATWALRATLPTFDTARMMGTSVEMIEATYGHLAQDAAEWQLQRLEAFDSDTDGRILDALENAE